VPGSKLEAERAVAEALAAEQAIEDARDARIEQAISEIVGADDDSLADLETLIDQAPSSSAEPKPKAPRSETPNAPPKSQTLNLFGEDD